jgi:hypothetical protein
MAMTLITTNTHTGDSDATSDFTSGIDSTYKLYIFKWYDVNPATDNVDFTFQANVVDASGYNETITSSSFRAYHTEADATLLGYRAGSDQAEGTGYQVIQYGQGNGGDESSAGELFLFNPASTTYVKHFYARSSGYYYGDQNNDIYTGGYFNVTGAIDDIQFKMSSGNFNGTISMYGVG